MENLYRESAQKVFELKSIINDIFGGFNKKHPEFIWIVIGCIASYFYMNNMFGLPQTIFFIYFIIKGTTEFIAAIVNRINNALFNKGE